MNQERRTELQLNCLACLVLVGPGLEVSCLCTGVQSVLKTRIEGFVRLCVFKFLIWASCVKPLVRALAIFLLQSGSPPVGGWVSCEKELGVPRAYCGVHSHDLAKLLPQLCSVSSIST